MPPVPTSLHAKIAALWTAKKPDVREKLAILERAAKTLEDSGALSTEQRDEAAAVAHKLAGSLGMFGHDHATDAARAIEIELDAPESPQAKPLREHVDRLRVLLTDPLQ